MTSLALDSFFSQLADQLPPQPEREVRAMNAYMLRTASFRSLLTVQTMFHVSRIIENAVVNNPRIADAHASFQMMSRYKMQLPRYNTIADAAKELWLYGAVDVPVEPHPRLTVIDTAGTRLVDFWWVIAYGPGISMTLLAEEIPSETHQKRNYRGFYTFNPEVAYSVINALHKAYPATVKAPTPPTLLRD